MNSMEQRKNQLIQEIHEAVLRANLADLATIPVVILEAPKDKAHGDYATNMAMQLARIAKKAPRQIAEELVQNIDKEKAGIREIDVAGPGFINFFMDNAYLRDIIPAVLEAAEQYGESKVGNNEKS